MESLYQEIFLDKEVDRSTGEEKPQASRGTQSSQLS